MPRHYFVFMAIVGTSLLSLCIKPAAFAQGPDYSFAKGESRCGIPLNLLLRVVSRDFYLQSSGGAEAFSPTEETRQLLESREGFKEIQFGTILKYQERFVSTEDGLRCLLGHSLEPDDVPRIRAWKRLGEPGTLFTIPITFVRYYTFQDRFYFAEIYSDSSNVWKMYSTLQDVMQITGKNSEDQRLDVANLNCVLVQIPNMVVCGAGDSDGCYIRMYDPTNYREATKYIDERTKQKEKERKKAAIEDF